MLTPAVLREIWETCVCYTTILMGIELLFCLPLLPRRRRFWLRAAAALPAYAMVFNSHRLVVPVTGTWAVGLYGALIFVASVVVLRILFDIGWRTAFFYGAASYSIEGTLFIVRNLDDYFPGLPQLDYVSGKLATIAACGLVLLFVWLLFARRFNGDENPDVGNGPLIWFVCAVLLVADLLSTWVRKDSLQSAPFAVCSVLCYALLLVVQFDLFRVSDLERERDLARRLFSERERQQRESQENVEAVNIKFHDIKHQIAALRAMDGGAAREQSLADLEHSVEAYDARVQTGNAALDAILTEKSTRCWSRKIDFTCMVDGSCLAFLGVVDLYTLLGNALDNAIEAAEKVPELAGRVVSVAASSRSGLVSLRIENSCVGRVETGDGLPATSKEDSANHGFGLRSIAGIVARHGGNLSLASEEGRFVLSILFPVPQGER